MNWWIVDLLIYWFVEWLNCCTFEELNSWSVQVFKWKSVQVLMIFIELINVHHNVEFSSIWWLYITMMTFIKMKNFHPKMNFIKMMNFYQNYEFWSQRQISIMMMNFHPNDEFSSQWSIFIKMMKFIKISQWWFSNHDDEFSSQWWLLITMMNFHHTD